MQMQGSVSLITGYALEEENMNLRVFTFFLSIVAPLLAGCALDSKADTPLPAVNYSVIAAGDNTISGLPENRKLEIYTNQTSFNSSFYLFLQPVAEPTVDFSSRRVALLSLGGRPTGGYSISAEKIEDYGEFIKASIIIKKPGSNCSVTQAQTSPYQFIEVESVKELLFEERVEVVNCI
jgi:hypothetical protein